MSIFIRTKQIFRWKNGHMNPDIKKRSGDGSNSQDPFAHLDPTMQKEI